MTSKFLMAVCLILVAGCSTPKTTVAKLDFPLPQRARYTVTDKQFEAAIALLRENFVADTDKLRTIVATPTTCGPGLWHVIQDSPHFVAEPPAKGKVLVPLANGQQQELPLVLFQNDTQTGSFCATLAELIAQNGALKFRLPTEKEFKTFWTVIPFDTIPEPLIVAEGERYNVIIEFSKGKPFWFDEVKHMTQK